VHALKSCPRPPPAAAPEAAPAAAPEAAPKPGEWSKAMPVTTEWLNKSKVQDYLARNNSQHLRPLSNEDYYFQKGEEYIYVKKANKDIDLNKILEEAKATLTTTEGKKWTPIISEKWSRPHNEEDPYLTIIFTKDGNTQDNHPERPNSMQTGDNPYLQYHFANENGNTKGFNYCTNASGGTCLRESSITSGGRRKNKTSKRRNKTHKKYNRKAKTSKYRKARKVSTKRR
jgi:hypothetical protein